MLADVTFSTESLAIIGGLGSGLVTTVVFLFKALIKEKDKQLSDMTSARDSYKEMATESINHVETAVNRLRLNDGVPEFVALAPVLAEHSSPTTARQREAAEMQTLRARLVAASLSLNLPPRPGSRPATPEEEAELKKNPPRP